VSDQATGRIRAAALALAAVAVISIGLSACDTSAVRTDKSKPILFVHGYNLTSTSTDCGSTFDTMIASLRKQGFTGPMVRVGFYSGDTNCDVNLHSYGSFGDRDSWKNIAHAMNTYVYNTYTSKGKTVDMVGYSMGANIVRGAVYGPISGESGWTHAIDAEDVLTLGGAHNGAAWYSYLCLWGQCHSLSPASGDISWLNQNGNPQGTKGTDWTVIGSDGDAVVPADSATHMSVPASNKVVYADVPHTGDTNYMHDATVLARSALALAQPNQ
jgi:hypothetical protein